MVLFGRAEALKTSLRTQSAPTTNKKNKIATTTNNNNRKRSRASTSLSTTKKDTPATTFQDVIGLNAAKQSLVESILLPQRQPQLFTGGRKPFNGILLYGPPGTGKTLLAKAIANESGTNTTFISVSSSDIMSK